MPVYCTQVGHSCITAHQTQETIKYNLEGTFHREQCSLHLLTLETTMHQVIPPQSLISKSSQGNIQKSDIGKETARHQVALPPKLNIQEYPREYKSLFNTITASVVPFHPQKGWGTCQYHQW